MPQKASERVFCHVISEIPENRRFSISLFFLLKKLVTFVLFEMSQIFQIKMQMPSHDKILDFEIQNLNPLSHVGAFHIISLNMLLKYFKVVFEWTRVK